MKIVSINKEPVQLYKILKFENLVESGGVAKSVISDGLVKVNGSVETRKRKKIISGDIIVFNGEKLCVNFTMNKGN
ncbi:MAG: RNA-binding protein [Porticoccus sp.]|nr:RNA-binding protein [Porticoccus sp.]|tara:strand:+ start:120 stop:347 length:228 start_codon:yes stop_codon:yes gene_type:complete